MKHIPRKRFGQNFLHDEVIIHAIIARINPQAGQTIIEIGPGLGALTIPMIEQIGHIYAVEIDRDIIKELSNRFTNQQLTIYEHDALQFDFSMNNQTIRVIGNLPYNISTPLLFHLSKFNNISDMTFMLQDEVVRRICAVPNNHDYGKLSVMLQYKFKCTKLLDVPPQAFRPAPKVNSAIVRLIPRTDYNYQEVDETLLRQIVGNAFNQRRKTIANSLREFFSAAELTNLGINPQLRAENLSVDDYLKLTKLYAHSKNQ